METSPAANSPGSPGQRSAEVEDEVEELDGAHIAIVCLKCFRRMLQVFHVDVAKVDLDVTMLYLFYTYVASVYPNIAF